MERPGAVNRLQLFWGCLVPIGVLLALLATLGVSLAIFSHRGQVIACTDSPCRQRSTSNVAPANSLMELSHNPRALLSAYTYKKGMCESKPVQLAVNKGKLAGALLYFPGLS